MSRARWWNGDKNPVLRRRGTDGFETLSWRRQSRANSSLEQANVDGQMTRGPGSIERNFGTTLCAAQREGTDNNFE